MSSFSYDNQPLLNMRDVTLDYFDSIKARFPMLYFTNKNQSNNIEKHAVYVYHKDKIGFSNRFIEIWQKKDCFQFVLKKSLMTEAEKAESKRDWNKRDNSSRGRVSVHMALKEELFQYITPKLEMIEAECMGDSLVLPHNDTLSRSASLESNPVQHNAESVIAVAQDIARMDLQGEEREAVVKVRVNQSEFRERLLHRYSKCCLCGVSDPNLLLASHIKPWAESDPEERLDIDNGFLFCPNHDKLFDKGYISFSDNGDILISPLLSETDRLFMNIHSDTRIDLTDKNKEYLVFHRNNIFKH